jgi:protocatechuate 3,4-dioxygenase beta subunit
VQFLPREQTAVFYPGSQANSPRLFVAAIAFCAIFAAGFWFVGDKDPGGKSGEVSSPHESAASDAVEGADLAGHPTTEAAGQGPGQASTSPTRERAAARLLVRGRARMPARLAASGGHARLHRASESDARSFAGLLGGIAERDRSAIQRSFGPADEQLAETALEPDGSFVFADPPNGPAWLSIDHPLARLPQPLHVRIPEEGEVDVGELELELAASLLVRVRDVNERPLPGARVNVYRSVDMQSFMKPENFGDMGQLMTRMMPVTRTASAEGVADFRGLARSPTYLVSATHAGHARVFEELSLVPGQRRMLTMRMLPGAKLAVDIVDEQGQPLDRCRVSFTYDKAPEIRNNYQTARVLAGRIGANGKGEIRSNSLRTGRGTLRASRAGYLSHEIPVVLRHGETFEAKITLTRGESISGRVVDAQGKALPEARVLLLDEMMSTNFLGMIDVAEFVGSDLVGLRFENNGGVRVEADGSFELGGLKKGEERKLMAIAPGHAVQVVGPFAAGSKDHEIQLAEEVRLVGRVVDDESGEPIRDFVVRANIKAWMFMERPVAQRRIQASEDGRFELAGFAPQSIEFVIESEGRGKHSQRMSPVAGLNELGVIRLGQPAGIAGRVLDADGVPVAGATVRVAKGGMADMSLLNSLVGALRTETDARGEFELLGVVPGKRRLIAEKEGHALERGDRIQVEPGKITRGVELRFGRGGAIDGQLVDPGGRPAAGWSIIASSTRASTMVSTETDANGRFRLEALAPGLYEVQAMPGDMQFDAAQRMQQSGGEVRVGAMMKVVSEMMRRVVKQKLSVREGEVHELRMTLNAEEQSSGTVRVQGEVRVGGELLEAGLVELLQPGRAESPLLVPIENGRYVLPGVIPGSYRVRVRAGIFAGPLGSPRDVRIAEQPVVQLDLRFSGTRLSGRVLDVSEGGPVANCVLTLERAGAEQAHDPLEDAEIGQGVALSDAKGAFHFRGLAPGRYRVHARENSLLGGRGRSGSTAWVQIGEEQQLDDVELLVGGAATLEVQVDAPSGKLAGALVRLLDAAGQPTGYHSVQLSNAEGVALFEGLPPGTYRVSVDTRDFAPSLSESVEVQRDTRRELRVMLEPGTPVQLVFAGTLAELESSELLAWSIWGPGGNLLRAGRIPAGIARARAASGKPLDFGKLRPGSYRLRVESRSLGRRDFERSVPSAGSASWRVE